MKNQSGLTLIEIMVTLAIISVLIALVAPRYGTITTANKLAASANALATDIAYTRSESVTRNSGVTIAAKSGNWSKGWTVTELTSNKVLRDVGAIPAGITLIVTPSTTTSITYKSDGSQSSGEVAIQFCNNNLPSGNTAGKEVRVITSGRQTVNSKMACP